MNAKTIATILPFTLVFWSSKYGEGGLHQIWKHNHILELTSQPNQIERILINTDFIRQSRSVVTAKPRSSIWIDAYTEVAYACGESGATDDIADGGVHVEVRLCG